MKFNLYRLSLTEPSTKALFDEPFEGDRKGFLRDIFSHDFDFVGWGGVVLKYIHLATENDAIFGSVCRWRSEIGQANPADPFAESEQGAWHHSSFLINLANDEQVIAVGDVAKVGKPHTQVEYLVRHLNTKYSGHPFKIDYFNVSREESFKKAIEAYPGKVTLIKFDVVAQIQLMVKLRQKRH
ncbi:hypothetical protein [Paracoccus haematequi]|uniref:hypothetical protein n=1 Tax=Paracoccus haematequi TaxID=2491866 RepID=UPI000F7F82C7|nr:hypothetical protein [Paracoccus haematequi]